MSTGAGAGVLSVGAGAGVVSVGAGAGVLSVGAGAGVLSVGAGAGAGAGGVLLASVLVLSVLLLSVLDDWLFVAGAFGLCGSEIPYGIAGAVGAGSGVEIGNPGPSSEFGIVVPLPDESHIVVPAGLV